MHRLVADYSLPVTVRATMLCTS